MILYMFDYNYINMGKYTKNTFSEWTGMGRVVNISKEKAQRLMCKAKEKRKMNKVDGT